MTLSRIIIISLIITITGAGFFFTESVHQEQLRIAEQKIAWVYKKTQLKYDKTLSDLNKAKAETNKTKHDLWLIAHLEKTLRGLEKGLPKEKEPEPLLTKIKNVNLVMVENIVMIMLMILSAIFYMRSGSIQDKKYLVTPGLKHTRYRQPPTDSVASNTYWQPMHRGGANFQTHILIEQAHDQLLLKSSGQMKMFFGVFILLGLNGMVFSMLKFVQRKGLDFALSHPLETLGSLLSVGLLFVILGLVFSTLFGSLNTLFDKRTGQLSNKNVSVPLNKIHALQIIEEIAGGSEGGIFKSYELNAVQKDGERIHLMDHGHYVAINADAEKLAEFLSVPIWEVS